MRISHSGSSGRREAREHRDPGRTRCSGVWPRAARSALLVGTLGRNRPDEDRDAALDLVHSCGRLPLALRIAAARPRNHPQRGLRYLTDRLRDADGRLSELVAENRGVAATIGLSYEALKPEPRDLFRLMGSLPGRGFDAYVAAAVTARPLAQAEELMEELLDAHPLVLTGGTRYAFHDLVRDYAQSLVDADDPEAPKVRQRVLDSRPAGPRTDLLVDSRWSRQRS